MIDKKKKILITHSSNDLYGASKILLQTIEILIAQQYKIFVVLPYAGPLDKLLEEKVSIYHCNLGVLRKKYFNFFGLINRFYYIAKSIFFLNKLIDKNEISIVYSNTSVIISGAFIAKIKNIRSYFHIHEIPTNSFYKFFIINFVNLFSDKIIVVSKAVRDHWFKKNKKVHVIYNGFFFANNLKKNEKYRDKNNIVMTSISRIIPYKGHIYLLKILTLLLNRNNNIILYILGDTFKGYEDYEISVKNYVLKNKLNKNVIFTGYKKNIDYYLNISDFFIHTPILPDPLPTVIFEAINSNTPVISTDVGGSVEILENGKGGLLIPHNNVNKSAELIDSFIKNSELVNKKNNYVKYSIKKKFNNKLFEKNIVKFFSN